MDNLLECIRYITSGQAESVALRVQFGADLCQIAVLFRVVLDHRALHEEGEVALENVIDTDLRVPEDRAFFGVSIRSQSFL